MDENGGVKLTGIRQIVRLKEMLQKWQTVTLGPKPNPPQSNHAPGSILPMINKRLTNVKNCDSDEDSCHSPESPPDVPRGYLAVYVGPELRRFIIPTSYLGHSLFKVLLEKAEEEFGFDNNGALTLPCEIETFKYLLKCIESQQKDQPADRPVPEEGKSSLRLDLMIRLLSTCSSLRSVAHPLGRLVESKDSLTFEE